MADVQNWERTVKKATVRTNAMKNDGIKMIIERYLKELSDINTQLLGNRKLTDDDRKYLFVRKDFCLRFLKLFQVAKAKLASVEKTVEESLSALQEPDV